MTFGDVVAVVRRSIGSTAVVATTAFAALGVAWALTTPPGAAPDEPSHYVRMVGLSAGRLLGERVDLDRPFGVDLSTEAVERVNREAGWYRLDDGVAPPNVCNSGSTTRPFACDQPLPASPDSRYISYHARYHPGAYIVPALFSSVGDTMWQKLFAGRIGFVAQGTVLFAVAVAAMSARRRALGYPSTGHGVVLALGVTPLLSFMTGTLAPNGTEVLAVAACTASAMALAQQWSRRWLWSVVGCATMASWSRDFGAPAVVVALVAVAATEPAVMRQLRSRRRELIAPAAVIVLALSSALVWQFANKVSILRVPMSSTELSDALTRAAEGVIGAVGLVGILDVRVHRAVEVAWLLFIAAGVGAALTTVARRTRLVVGTVVLVAALLSVELALGMAVFGFGFQARFVLPIASIAVVVLAMAPQRPAICSRVTVRGVLVFAAVGHLAALLQSAHRHAVGLGQPFDLGAAVWSPPFGWGVGVTLMLFGCSLVALVPLRTTGLGSGQVVDGDPS